MKKMMLFFLALTLVTAGCGRSYLEKLSAELNQQNKTIAFVGVNVIPMDREHVVKDQTVIVRDGVITALGTRERVHIPDGAMVVAGDGKYLMPGLCDMHVHINNEKDLFLFVANGVTTVQNMWGYTGFKFDLFGFPDQLELQEKIREGKLPGPTIYTAGSILEGKPKNHPFMGEIKTPEAAKKAVIGQKEKGYDFLKVYDNLPVDVYNAIMSAAKQYDIPVQGHVPKAVGIDRALASGQVAIDHLTGYIDHDAAEIIIPEDRIEAYAEKTRKAGVWNCPTMVV